MEDIKSQLANRLKESYNVLITVSTNPTIDQLSAAIGLTLMLNKLGKHATTVFSGAVPPIIEFLHPEKTIEKNTDSLRDFIISLDKAKADKLRYKIEDNFVKIFITPYHTSINEKDLVFSQGDFNVDVVVAIGVHRREELDSVITTHGRILHDATVSTVNTAQPSTLGSINWSDKNSSSLCEMVLYLSDLFGNAAVLDAQTANALLTGIVAETQRFSNQKTTSLTMSASSRLLAAGANQQLVASQLQPPKPLVDIEKGTAQPPTKSGPPPDKPDDKGVIRIDHTSAKSSDEERLKKEQEEEEERNKLVQVQIDDQGTLKTLVPEQPASVEEKSLTETEDQPAEVEEDKPKISNEEPAMKTPAPGSYMSTPPKDDDEFLGAPGEDDEAASNAAQSPAQPPLLKHDGMTYEETEATNTDEQPLGKDAPADDSDNKDGAGQDLTAPIESPDSQVPDPSALASTPVEEPPKAPTEEDAAPIPPPPVAPPIVDQPPGSGGTDQPMEAL